MIAAVGDVVSITRFLAEPNELVAPGLTKVSVALLPCASCRVAGLVTTNEPVFL